MKRFYFRRFAAIYPLYFLTCLFFFVTTSEPLGQKLLRLPLELTLTQSAVAPGLFPYAHNGGTWFLSCLMTAYLISPVFARLFSDEDALGQRSARFARAGIYLCIYVLCATLPFLVVAYSLPNVYSNSVLRCLQFLAGMMLAGTVERVPCKNAYLAGGLALASAAALFAAVSALVRAGRYLHHYVIWGYVTLPLFLLLVYGLVGFEKGVKVPAAVAAVSKAGRFCYPVFIAQFFVFDLTKSVTGAFPAAFYKHSNWKGLLLASGFCVILTLMLHYLVVAPCQKWLLAWSRNREKQKEGKI